MFLLCFHLWQIQMSIWRKYVKAWLKDLALNMWSMWVFTLDLDSSKNNTMAATTTQGREFIISRCLSLHLWFLLPQGYKLLIFNLAANRLHPFLVRLRPTSHPWLSLAQISFFSSLSQYFSSIYPPGGGADFVLFLMGSHGLKTSIMGRERPASHGHLSLWPFSSCVTWL